MEKEKQKALLLENEIRGHDVQRNMYQQLFGSGTWRAHRRQDVGGGRLAYFTSHFWSRLV